MKNKTFLCLLFISCVLSVETMYAQVATTPKIHRFVFDNGINLQQLSDNGAFAVAVGCNVQMNLSLPTHN